MLHADPESEVQGFSLRPAVGQGPPLHIAARLAAVREKEKVPFQALFRVVALGATRLLFVDWVRSVSERGLDQRNHDSIGTLRCMRPF